MLGSYNDCGLYCVMSKVWQTYLKNFCVPSLERENSTAFIHMQWEAAAALRSQGQITINK